MIIGIGNDIVDIHRIEKTLKKYSHRFAKKLLSPDEFKQWQTLSVKKSLNYIVKRWAAKEAFAKACGTGIRYPVLLSKITLTKNKLGKPVITADSSLTQWLKNKKVNNIHISLSDEKFYCTAFVILES